MRGRGALTVVLGVAAFAAGGITAEAADRAVPSTVKIVSLQEVNDYVYVQGTITSVKGACSANRRVVVKALLVNDTVFKFDVARSGGNGGWLAARPLDEVDELPQITTIEVKAQKQTVRVSKSKKIVCGADRAQVAINS